MEKQSEYFVIGDRFATYGMDYSHEILAKIFENSIFWMILEAFECPIVKKGRLQSYLILSSKGVFKNRNVFFTL